MLLQVPACRHCELRGTKQEAIQSLLLLLRKLAMTASQARNDDERKRPHNTDYQHIIVD
jgi:hypothetical protein